MLDRTCALRGLWLMGCLVTADARGILLDLYRFVLAIFVVQAHVPWEGGSGPLSQHAVFSFYVLSGFLMTLILNETYGFGPGHFVRFWTNRFLRLYPAYFIVIAITALHIWLVSPLTQLHGTVGLPEGVYGWIANVTMFGMAGLEISLRPAINFIPNAWSLSVELFCYVLLSIYFARTRQRALALLLIGIVITGTQLIRVTVAAPPNYDMSNHYNVLQAGIIPFAAGSLAYFYRQSALLRFSPARLSLLLLLWAVNCALAHFFAYHQFVSGLYVAVAINVVLVPMMFGYDVANRPARWMKVLGGISYPVFISHILIGTLVVRYSGFLRPGMGLLLATLAATIGFSLLVHLGVERRIETLRAAIKRRRWVSSFAWQSRSGAAPALPAE